MVLIRRPFTSCMSALATTVDFHSQGDLILPSPWYNPYVHCSDRALELVCYHSIPVRVTDEFLEHHKRRKSGV